jgi:hypothetical protein
MFLDEAGDFNFTVSGTKFFMITAITKARPFFLDDPITSLKYDLIEVGLDIEYFHASEDRQAVRDQVFTIIANNLKDFRIDSLIVEKRKTGHALQVLERFYPKMISYLVRYVLEPKNLRDYTEVIVITDTIPVTRKREAIEKAVKQILSKMLPTGTRYRILHHASKSCVSLQVADYCSWAIFRKWERGDLRSYDLIRNGIRSEFDIFRSGNRHYY